MNREYWFSNDGNTLTVFMYISCEEDIKTFNTISNNKDIKVGESYCISLDTRHPIVPQLTELGFMCCD